MPATPSPPSHRQCSALSALERLCLEHAHFGRRRRDAHESEATRSEERAVLLLAAFATSVHHHHVQVRNEVRARVSSQAWITRDRRYASAPGGTPANRSPVWTSQRRARPAFAICCLADAAT